MFKTSYVLQCPDRTLGSFVGIGGFLIFIKKLTINLNNYFQQLAELGDYKTILCSHLMAFFKARYSFMNRTRVGLTS